MKSFIQGQLSATFSPLYLEVVNESSGHNVPPGSETHFKIIIVSHKFEGVSPVKRHQAIYSCLQTALKQGVHALAIHAYTPIQWSERSDAPASPTCLGGGKKSSSPMNS